MNLTRTRARAHTHVRMHTHAHTHENTNTKASALEGIGGASSNVKLQSTATPLLVYANFNGFVYGIDPDPNNQFVAQVQTAMVNFIFGSDSDVSVSTPTPHGTYTSCVVTVVN